MKHSKNITSLILVFVSIQLTAQQNNPFTLSSSGVNVDGSLSIEFTGEGEGVSMPLQWSNVPKGTKFLALNLWHLPLASDPTVVKSYWVVYDIPSELNGIPKNATQFGTIGYNDKDKAAYDPMKSKGPGVKEYKLTVYALYEKLVFHTNKVYRSDLLKAIEGKVLSESTLKYTYETGVTGETSSQVKTEVRIETLSDEQKEKIRNILSSYNEATLNANDAKAIHEAFRKAGLRGSPSVDVFIENEGFDSNKLRELAPPPNKN